MAKLLHIFYHKEGTFSLLCQQVQRSLGYSFFLRKRIENVDAEASSMFIAYNLKRLFAVFSTQELIAKFR